MSSIEIDKGDLEQPLTADDHGHGHGHGGHDDEDDHDHGPEDPQKELQKSLRKLWIASGLCLLFMAGEIVGGLYAHSLAIMTDAAHLLSDVAGFMISIFALWIASRPASSRMSFGFHRAEILGALLSILLIWGLTGVLVYEAVQRVLHPEDVDGKIMFIVACCGIVINIVMGKVLHAGGGGHGHGGGGGHAHGGGEGGEDNINVRAAFLHVLGGVAQALLLLNPRTDFVQSIGVLIASILIWVKPEWRIADPICTFIFSILVLLTTTQILKDSIHVLMEGTPDGVDMKKLEEGLQRVDGVTQVHDLHCWSVTVGKAALSVHLTTTADPMDTLTAAEQFIRSTFKINHSTIQIEKAGVDRHGACMSHFH